MRRVFWALAVLVLVGSGALAQEDNLAGGVIITHYPTGIVFSDMGYPEGWCQHYLNNYAITDAANQNPRIDTEDPTIWYLLVAWEGDKKFCGVDFGFGAYNAAAYTFVEHGACYPGAGGGLEIPTAGWPGPSQGTSITCTGEPKWTGNYVPIYYFIGYAYTATPGQIPISVDPASSLLEIGNCMGTPITYPFVCAGKLGLFQDGVACTPVVPPSACCFAGGECQLLSQEECDALLGQWHPESGSCGPPSPCPVTWACCIGADCFMVTELDCTQNAGTWFENEICTASFCDLHVCCFGDICRILTESECASLGGDWAPVLSSCDPNPDPPCPNTDVEKTSWGEIKAVYR